MQYHPEAAAGPHDAAYLFDRFIDSADRLAERELAASTTSSVASRSRTPPRLRIAEGDA